MSYLEISVEFREQGRRVVRETVLSDIDEVIDDLFSYARSPVVAATSLPGRSPDTCDWSDDDTLVEEL